MHVLHHRAGKEIATAGAGLAGLAFALSLLQQCKEQGVTPLPKLTLFDRDASAEARAGQGYFLTVRSDTGGLQAHHSSLLQLYDMYSILHIRCGCGVCPQASYIIEHSLPVEEIGNFVVKRTAWSMFNKDKPLPDL